MDRMMMIEQFDSLTREQILALRPGVWGDMDLLDVIEYFEKEKKDRDRAIAVTELILHSPQLSEVDYHLLYWELIDYYRFKHNFPAALRWVHAMMVCDEQHNDGRNHASICRDLAEIYLSAGDLNTGLALFTRLAQADPTDIWNYNALCFSLPRAGLPHLAMEVLDYALALIAREDPEKLKAQLTKQRRSLAETLSSTADRSDDLSPAVLDEFRAAFLSSRPVSARRKQGASYLPPIDQLLTTDPSDDADLEAEIMAQGKVLAPELIQMAFDRQLPVDIAPARAVALLRALRDARTVELDELSAWLDQASGDWRNELLTRHCGKVGGYSTSELEALVADTQYAIYTRISASEGLVERAQRLPAQRERIVAFMRTLLTRPEADTAGEETLVGFLIGDLLDLDARDLYPEIKRAFDEDRVDTSIITLLDVHDHWGMASPSIPKRREDGLYLRLRCTACDRVREHFVQMVLLDLGTLDQQRKGDPVPYDPYIMDHEIVCPKCGAVDRYAMTPQARLALTVLPDNLEDMVALLSKEKSVADLPLNPRLHPFYSSVFGEMMHPLTGLDEYRRRIAADPENAKLFMRMGTLLRTICRYADALEAHRKAYALNSKDAEIALTLAMSEHDLGDPAKAKEMYEQVLRLELKGKKWWKVFPSDSWSGAAAEGLDLLKRGEPSPWSLPAYNPKTGQETEVHMSRTPPRSQKLKQKQKQKRKRKRRKRVSSQ
mgnify:CR=1 FL=1